MRKAIALLLTLLFIMLITLSIGIGLKQINKAAYYVENEKFLLQSSVILDDVLKLLDDNLKEYKKIEEQDTTGKYFYDFLDIPSYPFPLSNTGISVGISLSSARAKFNINSIADTNTTNKDLLESYLSSKMIDMQYIYMLIDVIKGKKEDQTYETDIFYEKPYLFKDGNNHITSLENLYEINDFYKQTYHNNKIDIINFQSLFSFNDNNYTIDLNCASPDVLEILRMTQVNTIDEEETEEASSCNTYLCTSLTDVDKENIKKYNASCEPQKYIEVVIDIIQENQSATIKFEYELKTGKGINFVYEI